MYSLHLGDTILMPSSCQKKTLHHRLVLITHKAAAWVLSPPMKTRGEEWQVLGMSVLILTKCHSYSTSI